MMASMGTHRARGCWEQPQTKNQTKRKQRPQATAEQIRLAQVISDRHDADFEKKVKLLTDITGKSQDECVIALYDSNGDVNRAINMLLEGKPDMHSWKMVGKKKRVSSQKDSGQAKSSEEGKENQDREKDCSRRHAGPPRRAKGSTSGQESGKDGAKTKSPSGGGTEKGRKGRGRGRGGSSGKSGSFSVQGKGTLSPADDVEPTNTDENYSNISGKTWNSTGIFEPDDGLIFDFMRAEGSNFPSKFEPAPGAWNPETEEWGIEDWNEDLSETKVFTASNVSSVLLPTENMTITTGQRISLALLLGKTHFSMDNESTNLEPSRAPSLTHPLVFNNSNQSTVSQPASGSTSSYHSMMSTLGKGFGDISEAKSSSTTGSQFLEQFKTTQALAQLAAQHPQSGESTSTSSWDMGSTTQSPPSLLYDVENPIDSEAHCPFTKRQAFPLSSAMMEVFLKEKPAIVTTSTEAPLSPPSPLPSKSRSAPHTSPGSSDSQSSSPQPAQWKLTQQKKKAALTSKIAALAADIAGLSLQFRALQFGSEHESTPTMSVSSSQTPSSLYTSPASDSSSTISSNLSQESSYLSCPIQSTTYTSQNSERDLLYEERSTQTQLYPNSISSSPQKDLPQTKNDFGSGQATQLQTTQSVDDATGPAVKSDSPSAPSSLPLNDTLSKVSLLTTDNHHSPALGSLSPSEELPNSTSTQQSSTLSTQDSNPLPSSSSSGRASTLTLLHTSLEREVNLHPSTRTFPTASSTVSAPPPVVNISPNLNGSSSLGLSLDSNSTVTASARSSSGMTSGKAPPNLPPGVPPLLPNPCIMAPGLFHAYVPQMYGYDDFQMLQPRFPMDYYSIPIPTPTTVWNWRDGSMASSTYPGDLSKFGCGDASSPAPATQPQQSPTQTHPTTQQAFLNPAVPPGYSYSGLPYYTGVPGLPSTFQYGPAVFPVPPTASKQHGVNVGMNASATPFQQPGAYGCHGYNPGVTVTPSNAGMPDISSSVYSKTQQSFERQGFHSGTPAASFNMPSALGMGGPIHPVPAPAYPPAPFTHILTPHQQPNSQILHYHLQQEGQLPYLQMILSLQRQQEEQMGSGPQSQASSGPQKPQNGKSAYNSYGWGGN